MPVGGFVVATRERQQNLSMQLGIRLPWVAFPYRGANKFLCSWVAEDEVTAVEAGLRPDTPGICWSAWLVDGTGPTVTANEELDSGTVFNHVGIEKWSKWYPYLVNIIKILILIININ